MDTAATAAAPETARTSVEEHSLLQRLAFLLGMSAADMQAIKESGCITPAEWKYTVLEKPSNAAEAQLWEAVQSAEGLDVGALTCLAVQATKQARHSLRTQRQDVARKPTRG